MTTALAVLFCLLSASLPISYDSGNYPYPTTFGAFFRHNPYCLVDPSCANPFASPSESRISSGFAANGFQAENSILGLALPNYLLFLGLLAAGVVAACRSVQQPWLRRIVLTAIGLWVWLEINRWFSYIPSEVGVERSDLVWALQHLAVDAVTYALLLGAWYYGTRHQNT